MSTKIHMVLCQLFVLLSITFVPLFLCAVSSSFSSILVFFATYTLLYFIIWSWLPVRCHKLGCVGRVSYKTNRISFFKTRLNYRCILCEYVYEADIFDPDITVEVSG